MIKVILQQAKAELEHAYDHPEAHDLEESIRQIQMAREQYGDKGTILDDLIRSLTQAKHSEQALKNAGDISSAGAFGEAFNALEQAIESYSDTNNDPY